MTINITYHGIESTEAIAAKIHEKFDGLEKYFEPIEHIDVEVGMGSHHHNKGEVFHCKVNVKAKGEVIRVEKEGEDLYKSIDLAKDVVRLELSALKERQREHRTHDKIGEAEIAE